MFNLFKNKKTTLILTLGVSLLSVLVCAISTFAWFQIDSQAPEFSNTASRPNLEIENRNVTGYKIQPTLGIDGFPDYSSSTVSSKKGGSFETTNNNQDNADLNFDVPVDGLGYYLVKKNPSDTYKYKYNSTSYATKFSEYSTAGVNYLVIESLSTSSSDKFIIREYSYNTSTYSTVNQKVDITKDTGDFNVDSTTYEITPTAGSSTTYKIWFNKATKKVSFEGVFNIASKNLAPKSFKKPIMRAGGATPEDYTLYILGNGNTEVSGVRYAIRVTSGTYNDNWYDFSDSGYRYNDNKIYKATVPGSFTDYEIKRDNAYRSSGDYELWGTSPSYTYSTSTNYLVENATYMNFDRSSFSSVVYDGWTIVGSSTNSESTFYNKNFSVSDAIRLDSAEGNNYGKKVVDLRAGDIFKIAYLKNNTLSEWYGFYYDGGTTDRMEVYGGSVSSYFTNDGDNNCVVKTGVSLHCTIYFTNNNDDKHINVNISSSVIIKAAKFDFEGTFEAVDSTDAASKETILGSTVTKASLNELSFTIPANYTRVGTDIYTTSACSSSVGTSFVADTNPKIVYIKVQENAISITLEAFFSDSLSSSSGTVDSTRTKTLDSQFGANSSITAASLESYWKAASPSPAYANKITYSGTSYTFARIDNSSHNGAFSTTTGASANGNTYYVRYVRDSYDITLTPSYFEPSGERLDFSIQSTQTEVGVLDNSAFSTSKTFDNCEYKDHTNGIWYVFHRADSTWYTDADCTTPLSGNISSSNPSPKTLYAKMVAYPLTTFYIDADNPGWNNCYLHMWGTLGGVSSTMDTSLTAASITTDSGNKLFRISIPTTDITGFLIHNGTTSGDSNKTSNVLISSLTASTSKYLYIGSGSPHSATFVEFKSTAASGVWVQKYSGGSWNNVANGQLLLGDGVGNDFILESGLTLTNNDIIRVCDTKNTVDESDDVTYGYSDYVSVNTSKHTYVKTYDSGNAIQITNLGAADKTDRFNFYITHSGEISIAMVPDYGNGYYIMKYNSTDKTENFIGAIKMDSSDYTASYDGWYCGNTSEKIFIRSYLNAVDNICTSLTNETYATMKTSSGDDQYCITFKATGHYNIKVTNRVVDITQYNADDFFSLNKLNSSLVSAKGTNDAKQQEIWRQQTAVVMEIPFVANNPYNATVKLTTDCSASWVGVRFAVYSSKQGDPYNLMRGNTNALYTSTYLTDASLGTQIADVNSTTISANTATTYYAYVLIDYRYTVTDVNLTGSTPEVGIYLQIVQS